MLSVEEMLFLYIWQDFWERAGIKFGLDGAGIDHFLK
jgi:hypothetical protein